MHYVLLIYQGSTPIPNTAAWATLSEQEQQAVYADYAAIGTTPGVSPGLPLGLAQAATTVTVVVGRRRTVSGPYLGDAERAVAGWFVVEADDVETALQIAAKVPAARLGGAIEVRPVETYW